MYIGCRLASRIQRRLYALSSCNTRILPPSAGFRRNFLSPLSISLSSFIAVFLVLHLLISFYLIRKVTLKAFLSPPLFISHAASSIQARFGGRSNEVFDRLWNSLSFASSLIR